MALPLTKDWLVTRFLAGVDLTDDQAQMFAEGTFDLAIRSAIAQVSKLCDIEIEQVPVIGERHDWDEIQWEQWAQIQLRKRPIVSLDQMKFSYGVQDILSVPPQWITQVLPESGVVELIPLTSAQIQPATGYGIVPWMGPGLGGGARTIPGYYKVDYTAGFPCWTYTNLAWGKWNTPDPVAGRKPFGGVVQVGLEQPVGVDVQFTIRGTAMNGSMYEQMTIPVSAANRPACFQLMWESVTSITVAYLTTVDGVVPEPGPPATVIGDPPPPPTWFVRGAKIDADVLYLIGALAVINPLNIAGDLVFGAGVQEREIDIDSLRTRTVATASAENTAYGARVKQYMEDIKRLVPAIRRVYHGYSLRVA